MRARALDFAAAWTDDHVPISSEIPTAGSSSRAQVRYRALHDRTGQRRVGLANVRGTVSLMPQLRVR